MNAEGNGVVSDEEHEAFLSFRAAHPLSACPPSDARYTGLASQGTENRPLSPFPVLANVCNNTGRLCSYLLFRFP